ncbi:MAG: dihydrolipoamide acetyltransferase family protein [Steroidobacterales bacterium]
MNTFRLPDLGEGLAEAEIVEWHVKVGDRVSVDAPMVSVETAKAVVELPAPFSGVVARLYGAAGDILATGAPLIDFESDHGSVVGSMPAASDEEFIEAAAAGVAPTPHAGADRSRALPVARALARRLSIDLATVKGSGRDGLITLDDVLQRSHVPAAPPVITQLAAQAGIQPAPLRGARRAMAHTMSIARDQTALSAVCDDADLERWTDRGNYMLRLMRALVHAWRAEPALNAWYDPADNSRILCRHMDLGVAVDTQGGLLVPVLRNVDAKSPEELKAALALHKAAAHERSTTAEDLQNATILLSNFGSLAGRYATPQVVPPAVAILGAGKVRREPVVVGERIEAHLRMPLSLGFDHRCVTGGEACRFLAALIEDLEKAH